MRIVDHREIECKWNIVHERDTEDGQATEWALKVADGNFIGLMSYLMEF